MGDNPHDYKKAISDWGRDIYEPIAVGDPNLWIPTPHLEVLLNEGLQGLNLAGIPIRTRSKDVKTAVCNALGYPVPTKFTKTRPRFPGQQLDTYVQKSNNLQVWNEKLTPTRRYALIRVSANGIVLRVKVVNGQTLALLDTTGTITTKYQAKLETGKSVRELVSVRDTEPIRRFVMPHIKFSASASPINEPSAGQLLPIAELRSGSASLNNFPRFISGIRVG